MASPTLTFTLSLPSGTVSYPTMMSSEAITVTSVSSSAASFSWTATATWVENTSLPVYPWVGIEQLLREPVADPREREDFQQIAFTALRELVTRHPRSREALLWAMREGLIDGTTYGTFSDPQKDTHTNWLSSPCCIVGWVMRATGTRNSIGSSLDVAGRNELEAFVRDIHKGETHSTNKWLGLLYRQLEELQV